MEQIVFIVKQFDYTERNSKNVKVYFTPQKALEFFELYKPDIYCSYYLQVFNENEYVNMYEYEQKERFINDYINK